MTGCPSSGRTAVLDRAGVYESMMNLQQVRELTSQDELVREMNLKMMNSNPLGRCSWLLKLRHENETKLNELSDVGRIARRIAGHIAGHIAGQIARRSSQSIHTIHRAGLSNH